MTADRAGSGSLGIGVAQQVLVDGRPADRAVAGTDHFSEYRAGAMNKFRRAFPV
jgi:hypothetical protein